MTDSNEFKQGYAFLHQFLGRHPTFKEVEELLVDDAWRSKSLCEIAKEPMPNGLAELTDKLKEEFKLSIGDQIKLNWELSNYFVRMTRPQIQSVKLRCEDETASDILEQLLGINR